MANHCVEVICKNCGAIYCIRCHSVHSLPDPDNIKFYNDEINTYVEGEACVYCFEKQLYIY